MQTLGQKLRAAREARGLSIDQIASETRINSGYFRALEEDNPSALPGGFFYRSFVRQYGTILELPETEYQREIEQSIADQERMLAELPSQLPERRIDVPPMPTGMKDPVQDIRRWSVRLAGLFAVMLVCAAGYLLWNRFMGAAEKAPDAATVAATTPAPTPAASAAPTPVPTAVPTPVPTPTPPPATAGALIQVTLTAKELTWVDAWTGNKLIFSDALRSGNVKTIEALGALRLRLGNAGGVSLEQNGKPLPPAGARGMIVTLEFSPQGYRIAPPKPPAPPQE